MHGTDSGHAEPDIPALSADHITVPVVPPVALLAGVLPRASGKTLPSDEHAAEDRPQPALDHAAYEFTPAEVTAVLARWHALATMAANPLTNDEREQVNRAKDGYLAGLYSLDDHGGWVKL